MVQKITVLNPRHYGPYYGNISMFISPCKTGACSWNMFGYFCRCKKAQVVRLGLSMGAWRCPTLTWGDPTLPSALLRFTSEFGMESGGSTALWPPSINCQSGKRFSSSAILYFVHKYSCFYLLASTPLRCCMVKPHGSLVQVSSMPYNTYTPCLSTL